MSARMLLAAMAAVSLAGVVSVVGCSSSSNASSDGGGADATPDTAGEDGSSGDGPVDAPADADKHKACTPDLAYAPLPWLPPSAWGQGVCSPGQISTFFSDCIAPDVPFGSVSNACTGFLGDPTNTACAGCLATTAGSDAGSTWGPYFITTDAKGQQVIHINAGGCAAHFDGMTTIGSCGEKLDDGYWCQIVECIDCEDYSHTPGVDGPHTTACFAAAHATGAPCNAYDLPQACMDEFAQDGGAIQVCNDRTMSVALWCGSAGGG